MVFQLFELGPIVQTILVRLFKFLVIPNFAGRYENQESLPTATVFNDRDSVHHPEPLLLPKHSEHLQKYD